MRETRGRRAWTQVLAQTTRRGAQRRNICSDRRGGTRATGGRGESGRGERHWAASKAPELKYAGQSTMHIVHVRRGSEPKTNVSAKREPCEVPALKLRLDTTMRGPGSVPTCSAFSFSDIVSDLLVKLRLPLSSPRGLRSSGAVYLAGVTETAQALAAGRTMPFEREPERFDRGRLSNWHCETSDPSAP